MNKVAPMLRRFVTRLLRRAGFRRITFLPIVGPAGPSRVMWLWRGHVISDTQEHASG